MSLIRRYIFDPRVTGHPKLTNLRPQAINVLSQAVSLLGLKAENRETEDKIELVGPRFLCKSCNSPIVMNFQRLVSIVWSSGSTPLT